MTAEQERIARPIAGHALTPLPRAKRLSDQVAEVLLQRIREAELRPGDRLPSERLLAERLQVARTVVREAVRELAARGIITVRPGTGVVVAKSDGSAAVRSLSLFVAGSPGMSFEAVFEVRQALEVEIAHLAASRASKTDIDLLRAAFERQISVQGDTEESIEADFDFHRSLALSTSNPLFVVIIDSLRDVLIEVRRQAMRLPGNLEAGYEAHRRVLDAVSARDPKAARREMTRHFEVSYSLFFSEGLSALRTDPDAGVPE